MRAAAAREDGCVDADELPVDIHERAARIAGIDRSVGLNEELIIGDADLRARQCGHDAARHGLPDAERIADREHEVTDLEAVGVVKFEGRKLDASGFQPENREVRLLVLGDEVGGKLPAVGKHHRDLRARSATLNDVVVRHHHAIGADNDAGAERILHALARHAEILTEQAAEEGIVGKGRVHLLDLAPRIDVDHGGRRLLHHRCERLLDRPGIFRDHALLRLHRAGRPEPKQKGTYKRKRAMFPGRIHQMRHDVPWLGLGPSKPALKMGHRIRHRGIARLPVFTKMPANAVLPTII